MVQGLIELDAIGGVFTWLNGSGPTSTYTRLDRILASPPWINKWSQVQPTLLFGNTSDHAAMYLELIVAEHGSKPFKFYNSWTRDHAFNDVFADSWVAAVKGRPLFRLHRKMKMVKGQGYCKGVGKRE